MYRSKSGDLLMLWSSYTRSGYALGVSRSLSASLSGPWAHEKSPLYESDGGHGMLFRTFDGKLFLALHAPNRTPEERLRLIELEDCGESLRTAAAAADKEEKGDCK